MKKVLFFVVAVALVNKKNDNLTITRIDYGKLVVKITDKNNNSIQIKKVNL